MAIAQHTPTPITFKRIWNIPLVKPDPSLDWEAGGVMAPAVIRTGNKWIMFYRAFGKDRISRLGFAQSNDGIVWRKDPKPRVKPLHDGFEYSGVEDPRIVKIDNYFFITYTAFAARKVFRRASIRILKTNDFVNFQRLVPQIFSRWQGNDKDAALFPEKVNGKFVLLHRLEPSIRLSASTNLIKWQLYKTILKPTSNPWESAKVGAGAPPIKTALGWLVFYHGVSADRSYSMSAAVLDIMRPTKVLYRLPFPLLSPEADYESVGIVQNVVFGTSAIEVDGEYRLYYGAADKVIAAASINKASLLETLAKYPVV